jgi:hypothetical protein
MIAGPSTCLRRKSSVAARLRHAGYVVAVDVKNRQDLSTPKRSACRSSSANPADLQRRLLLPATAPNASTPATRPTASADILKVTSGSTPAIADFVDALYRRIITAGTHKASSIKVAEAAKVIENTQRDLNIA